MDNKRVLEIIQAGLAWANWTDEQREAFLIGAEAVKKQIPLSRELKNGKYFCPICQRNRQVVGYCDCGQKLY